MNATPEPPGRQSSPRGARPAKADFTLAYCLRVRWAEVDLQGVVFNAHYLTYFDIAIAEYWREIGRGRERELREIYMRLYAVKATVEFYASAHYDEEIETCTRVTRLGRSSLTFAFGIWRDAEHLISGEIVYVYADPQTKQSAPLPELAKHAILEYERVKPETAPAAA
jgi:acyl-CoA thioester hydrolase